MNLTGLLIGALLWIATVGGGFWYGTSVGKNGEIAKQAEILQAIKDTREQARLGTADVLSKIKVKNTTIQGKVETIIRDTPVYRDCVHPDATLRLLNEALTGKSGSGRTGDSSLPGTDPTE